MRRQPPFLSLSHRKWRVGSRSDQVESHSVMQRAAGPSFCGERTTIEPSARFSTATLAGANFRAVGIIRIVWKSGESLARSGPRSTESISLRLPKWKYLSYEKPG